MVVALAEPPTFAGCHGLGPLVRAVNAHFLGPVRFRGARLSQYDGLDAAR